MSDPQDTQDRLHELADRWRTRAVGAQNPRVRNVFENAATQVELAAADGTVTPTSALRAIRRMRSGIYSDGPSAALEVVIDEAETVINDE